jgi:hypothetical protein
MTPPSNEHKPWHASVEKALRAAQDRGEPFTIESVLNGVGLFSWTLDREQAVVFANKLLAGSSGERIHRAAEQKTVSRRSGAGRRDDDASRGVDALAARTPSRAIERPHRPPQAAGCGVFAT